MSYNRQQAKQPVRVSLSLVMPMKVYTEALEFETRGEFDTMDLTASVEIAVIGS